MVWRGRRAGRGRVRDRARGRARGRPGATARHRRRGQAARSAARRAPPGLRWRRPLMCGVVGIHAPERDVARLAYFGLFALQHRGQESAGIAVSDNGRLTAMRDMGLVSQVFSEENLQGLRGQAAIAHCRYSTTGSVNWTNAQPVVLEGPARRVALGHNGNLVNTTALREELDAMGVRLRTTSDTEVIAAFLAYDQRPLEEAVAATMQKLEGAYATVVLSEGKLLGFRDPQGIRPLVVGKLEDDPVIASETCALDLLGADFEREVGQGELVVCDENGVRGIQVVPEDKGGALCIFEFIYFGRP